MGEDLLLGVGQDATDEGLRLGAQVSLFDVRDPETPRRLAQIGLGEGSWTAVEGDHHAFLHWPPAGLAVLPLVRYAHADRDQDFAGAVGVHVGRTRGLAEAGRVVHEAGDFPGLVQRSLVVGGRLFTVSDAGVEAGRLDTLAEQAFVAFP